MIQCDDNVTSGDSSDATFTFSITVIGRNIGTNWSTVINGNAVSGEYNQVYTLGAYPVSGILNFALADSVTPSCTINTQVDPNDCSY